MNVHGNPRLMLRRGRWFLWLFAVIAVVFLGIEHRAHVLGAPPWLIAPIN